jgi:hypothetical protein
VTIYRAPWRGDDPIDKRNPSSFAFISETRIVDVPPGPVTIRFEGVAGGIVPQSAILFGAEPRERNRDAALLSQGGLVDAFTGQHVILRRTDPATGKITEEPATIRSSADRLVVSTPRGVEALYCSGLQQTLIYPNLPTNLSAKPVLSMTTKDQLGGRVTVTLAYIANGFDWDATYVATLAKDGKSLELFSWLTMVSGDDTSFVDATTSAMAGRVNRSGETSDETAQNARQEAENLNLYGQCWPSKTTTTDRRQVRQIVPPPPQGEIIIVTAKRRESTRYESVMAVMSVGVTARPEKVGDLVLYKIPIPVTVAARSQKQVAFLADKKIKGEVIYRSRIYPLSEPYGTEKLFRFTNTIRSGLGQPIPAGELVLYQDSILGRQLIGQASIANKTINEDVELVFGDAQNVTIEQDHERDGNLTHYVVRNANKAPVRFELEFMADDEARFTKLPRGLISKPGKKVWSVILPANSQRSIAFDTQDSTEK